MTVAKEGHAINTSRKLQAAYDAYRHSKRRRRQADFSFPTLVDKVVELTDDQAISRAVLAFGTARYRCSAREAVVIGIAAMMAKEWPAGMDQLLVVFLLEQAGIDDAEGRIAALAQAVGRESDFGAGLYLFARWLVSTRSDQNGGQV